MASSIPSATSPTLPPFRRSRIWQNELWLPALLIVILVVATFLRFYALANSSLWSDEGNTWALIQRPFATIAHDAAADIHPPGYYWLLKGWAMLFGFSAASMRAFSALAGVLLVGVIYAIGRRLDRLTANRGAIALTAAWLAALNPFQLYYSQEARMYLLLALAGAGLFWTLLIWMEREAAGQKLRAVPLYFVLWGALGLWTHYSFPIILAAAGLAYLWHWRTLWLDHQQPWAALLRYAVANLVILLIFAPWLPTAIDRVLHWPQGGKAILFNDGVLLTLRTLIFGPLRQLPDLQWPWLVAAALLPLLGIIALARYRQGMALAIWLLAPVVLMFALGLFSDAFLKFLLAASPAWALLCAAAPLLLPRPRWGAALIAAGALLLAVMVLPAYFTSPTVRDNYAGVAAYIKAMGNPANDVVILDAPGQGDVWGYYTPGLPIVALPQSRPPDANATIAQLQAAVKDRRQLFGLFWATDEADPDHLVESWLDQHAFRGLESWQGNLRFVVYTMPNRLNCRDFDQAVVFGPNASGDAIQLTAQCQPAFPQRIPAGQVALLGLKWLTQQPLSTRYKVTVQLLDARNQVIAQHDAEPAGGSRPTDSWQPNSAIDDNHGLTIPFGTPPGIYHLIVALYDFSSGERLHTVSGDATSLGEIEVVRPQHALPVAIVPMLQRLNTQLGPITLLGYDAYQKDHSFAPETPLHAGDLAHFTFYWQAPNPLPADWPADLNFTLTLGGRHLSAPLAGGAYPTANWQPGETVRGEFDLPYDGSSNVPAVEVDGWRKQLETLPN